MTTALEDLAETDTRVAQLLQLRGALPTRAASYRPPQPLTTRERDGRYIGASLLFDGPRVWDVPVDTIDAFLRHANKYAEHLGGELGHNAAVANLSSLMRDLRPPVLRALDDLVAAGGEGGRDWGRALTDTWHALRGTWPARLNDDVTIVQGQLQKLAGLALNLKASAGQRADMWLARDWKGLEGPEWLRTGTDRRPGVGQVLQGAYVEAYQDAVDACVDRCTRLVAAVPTMHPHWGTHTSSGAWARRRAEGILTENWPVTTPRPETPAQRAHVLQQVIRGVPGVQAVRIGAGHQKLGPYIAAAATLDTYVEMGGTGYLDNRATPRRGQAGGDGAVPAPHLVSPGPYEMPAHKALSGPRAASMSFRQ